MTSRQDVDRPVVVNERLLSFKPFLSDFRGSKCLESRDAIKVGGLIPIPRLFCRADALDVSGVAYVCMVLDSPLYQSLGMRQAHNARLAEPSSLKFSRFDARATT